MAMDSDTFLTYDAVGNREDLSDEIYRIAPTDTPFLSAAEKTKATAVNHEWQIQELAAATAANAVLEGDDATTDVSVATVRRGNICQISDKVARVSGTQQAVDHAGRGDELDYQAMLKGLELKRDMETILIGTNQGKDVGAEATARKVGAVLAWVATNDVMGAGSPSSPSPIDGTDPRNDGTQRAFTESLLKNVIQLCWNEGGNPETIMVGGFNKQVMSTFTGRATPTEDTKAKKIVASVDAYESDFGTLKVVPNRFQRARDAWVLQMDMWAIAYLNGRKMVSIPLAVTGDSRRKQILSEYTLEARNEKASGLVADLTTS